MQTIRTLITQSKKYIIHHVIMTFQTNPKYDINVLVLTWAKKKKKKTTSEIRLIVI